MSLKLRAIMHRKSSPWPRRGIPTGYCEMAARDPCQNSAICIL